MVQEGHSLQGYVGIRGEPKLCDKPVAPEVKAACADPQDDDDPDGHPEDLPPGG